MWKCLLLLAVVLLVNGKKAGPPKLPGCEDLKCPAFTVLRETEDYQVRQYPSMRWLRIKFVTNASPSSEEFWEDRAEAVDEILDYFNGQNGENLNFTMHRPMFTAVCNATGSVHPCKGEHYIHMFLPDKEPDPEPTNLELEYFTSKQATYFVKGFHGKWEERVEDHRANLRSLLDALEDAGEVWDDDYHYYATYIPLTDDGYEEDWLKVSDSQ